MKSQLQDLLRTALATVLEGSTVPAPADILVEPAKDKKNGDFATNLALTLAKPLGKPVKRLDTPDKVNGAAVYGIDVMAGKVKVATMRASPVVGGKLRSVDDAKAKLVAADLQSLPANKELMAYAEPAGASVFRNNCAQCHGSDARGSKGFPNLTDNDWLHGGTPDKIAESINQGRKGVMNIGYP